MLPEEKKIQPIGKIEKSVFQLGEELDLLQREAKNLGIPILILVDGWESSGRGYVINRMRRELDPRYYHVRLFDESEETDNKYPMLRRFWEELPKKGYMSIVDQSYYTRIFNRHDLKKEEWERTLLQWLIQENILIRDSMIIVKIFLDISQPSQAETIRSLEESDSADFLVSDRDRNQNKNYDAFRKHMNAVLTFSNTICCPWTVISMEDRKNGAKLAMQTVIDRITARFEEIKNGETLCPPVTEISKHRMEDVQIPDLTTLDVNAALPKKEYNEQLESLQEEARDLAYRMYTQSKSMIIVFEGTDAAGKGGAIKRLTKHIDPRSYRIHTTAAPSEEEKQYNYMHRFITKLPSSRQIRIFDRSWYGRVMVERIEGFATENEWQRAYDEINALESEWMNEGIRIIKFYIAIDKDEQKKRFEARQTDPTKQYKLTEEDWRNREKWDQYEEAVQDMFNLTSTQDAPWILIPGNDKRYARVAVLKHVVEQMKEVLQE